MARFNPQRLLWPAAITAVLLLIAGAVLSSGPGTQLRIVHEIRRAGGSVGIIAPKAGGIWERITTALPDAFGDVHTIRLVNVRAHKHWLQAARDWKYLNSAWLNRASVEDDDLRYLSGHPSLSELYLNGNPITDRGLQLLGTLPDLSRLELDWTGVRRLDNLKTQFPHLMTLKLRGSQITDDVLPRLGDSPHLSELDLSRTLITDSAIGKLTACHRIRFIDLHQSRTTAAGGRRLHSLLPNTFIRTSEGEYLRPPSY